MSNAPKPVSFTAGANPTPNVAPQPLIIVGSLPPATIAAALKLKPEIAALNGSSTAAQIVAALQA